MNAKEILVHSLRLLENGDARGWCDLFHPEGVLEFPYAPPGWKTRFEGRETIWAHMRLFPEHLTVRFTDVQFYETADPDLAIGEFHGDGVATVSGGKLAQDTSRCYAPATTDPALPRLLESAAAPRGPGRGRGRRQDRPGA